MTPMEHVLRAEELISIAEGRASGTAEGTMRLAELHLQAANAILACQAVSGAEQMRGSLTGMLAKMDGELP
jgi:hypothetical protein